MKINISKIIFFNNLNKILNKYVFNTLQGCQYLMYETFFPIESVNMYVKGYMTMNMMLGLYVNDRPDLFLLSLLCYKVIQILLRTFVFCVCTYTHTREHF